MQFVRDNMRLFRGDAPPARLYRGRSSMGVRAWWTLRRWAAIAGLLPALAFCACSDAPPIPQAIPAVDSAARRYLRIVASHNLDSIRLPLSAQGREMVDPISMARIFGYFERGMPQRVTLADAEYATSTQPTPAERHRLTYRLDTEGAPSYYYFFEMTVERGDSLITGFRIEPQERGLAR